MCKRETMVLVADTETTTIEKEDGSQEVTCWLAGFSEARTKDTALEDLRIPDVKTQRTIESHIKSLLAVPRKYNCDTIVYYHNIKFDASLILDSLLKQGYKNAHVEDCLPSPTKKEIQTFNETLFDIIKSEGFYIWDYDQRKLVFNDRQIVYGKRPEESITLKKLLEVTGLSEKDLERRVTLASYDNPLILDWSDVAKCIKAAYINSKIDWYRPMHMPKKSLAMVYSSDNLLYSLTICNEYGYTITIQDSYKIEAASLKNLCKSYKTKYQKKEMVYKDQRDSNTKISKEDMEYFKHDVLSLAEIVGGFRSNGMTRLTVGACSLHGYKEMLEPEQIIERLQKENETVRESLIEEIQEIGVSASKNKGYQVFDLLFPHLEETEISDLKGPMKNGYEYMRQYYRGAWTYLKKDCKGVVYKKGCSFDVNSLYPSEMVSEKYPIGEPLKVVHGSIPPEIYQNNRQGFIEFKCSFKLKEGHLPFVQQKNHSIYKASKHLESSDDYDYNFNGKPYSIISGMALHDVISETLGFDLCKRNNGAKLFSSNDETGKEFIELCQSCKNIDGQNPHSRDFTKVFEWLKQFCHDNVRKELVIVWKPVMKLYMTQQEFDLFLEQYDVQDLEIIQTVVFEAYYGLFSDYVEYHTQGKIEAEKEGNGAGRQFHKNMNNNLYGKFATTSDASYKKPYLENDVVKYKTIWNPNGKRCGYVPVAACITANARIFTIRAAQANYENFIYADTDSIHLNCDPSEVKGIVQDPYKLSCWKLENKFKLAVFWRQKCYMEIAKNEKANLKFAGVSEKGKMIMLLSQEKYTTWHDVLERQMGKDSIMLQDLSKDQMLFLLGSQKEHHWQNIIAKEQWDLPNDNHEIRKEIESMYNDHGIDRPIGKPYNLIRDIKDGYTAPIKLVAKTVKGGQAILNDWYTFKMPIKKDLSPITDTSRQNKKLNNNSTLIL